MLLTLVCTFIFTKQYAFQSINKRRFDFFLLFKMTQMENTLFIAAEFTMLMCWI